MSTLDHAPKPQRMRRKKAIELALIVVMFGYLASALAWREAGAPYLLVVALGAVLCVLSFLWPASMDEFEKQTHFTAWYWGGTAGICVTAAVILALAPMTTDLAGAAEPTQRQAFTAGLAFGLAPPAIGYLVGLVVLWLRRR